MSARSSRMWAEDTYHSIRVALTLVVTVLILGTVGFMAIEHWDLLDSFFMTVITLSTVGFEEVRPLTPVGKLFTSALIFIGVGVAAYSFTVLARSVVEGELGKLRGFYRMQKKIATFKNHTIICGYGRLSRNVVPDLLAAGQNVVVIENAPLEVAELEAAGIPYVEGNAYEEETLTAAGIESARNLLAILSKDADNVYITLCARDLNPSIHIVGRAEGETGEKKLRQAGANQVLSPYRTGGARLVQRLVRPNVSEFLEIAAGSRGNQLVLEEVVVPERSAVGGKTLEAINLRGQTDVIIAAIINREGQMNFNPGRESVIQPGATMIVLGQPASVERLSELLEQT